MLIYSTRFRVVPEFDKEEFIRNISDWNNESNSPIEGFEENSFSFIAGDDNNNIEVAELAEKILLLQEYISAMTAASGILTLFLIMAQLCFQYM